MTEKEKCLNGLLYDANHDGELIAERTKCKDLCFRHNQLLPSDIAAREALIREIVGTVRGGFLIEPAFWCDYGYNIEIGENFYSNHNCVILDAAKVVFGRNVFIGPNCGFYTSGHAEDADKRIAGLEYAYPISVGDNTWIGGNVSVMPGVTIGDNTIIGGGSVVTKNIPSGVIAVGNPCRVLRPANAEK